ncbi:MAG: bifunctional riboflavin kinase/FAD synthetase [Saprospiraceae bacterium]
MKVYKDLAALPRFRKAVITIGSYDGVHAGHQAIIQRINNIAKEQGGESIMITFYPHPRFVVRPDDPFKLINTIDEKVALLEKYGVDNVVIVPFTKAFSKQTPEEYIQGFLVDKFQPNKIVIGYDHKFGNKRAGNIDLLKTYAPKFGFEVLEIQKQDVDTIVVSSTKIRKALQEGSVKKAKEWLNHPFVIQGKVVYGQQLGTKIGFPTANIEVTDKHKLIPLEGIYAVKVKHHDTIYNGMLYIGNRPTINGADQSIEVNIFDFDKNIYGDQLTLEFIERTRDDKKFDTIEGLQKQLAQDKIDTLKVLKSL